METSYHDSLKTESEKILIVEEDPIEQNNENSTGFFGFFTRKPKPKNFFPIDLLSELSQYNKN